MNMQEIIIPRSDFSENEVFEQLMNGDNMVEVTGFVDEITSTKTVSNGRFRLMTFILSNDQGKRVQVLVWGDQIEEHGPRIQMRSVIHLDGLLCKGASMNFWREKNNLIPFELSIQKHTVITFLGMYPTNNDAPLPPNQAPIQVDFHSIATIADGTLIEITGALKNKFRAIVTPGRANRYGCSVITNGSHKLTVVVNNYSAENEVSTEIFERTNGIKVIGLVKIDVNSMIKIVCDNVNRISLNESFHVKRDGFDQKYTSMFPNVS